MRGEFLFVEQRFGFEVARGELLLRPVAKVPPIYLQGKVYALYEVPEGAWGQAVERLERGGVEYRRPRLEDLFERRPLVEKFARFRPLERAVAMAKISAFLEFASTFTGSGTFYHSQQALCRLEERLHSFVCQLDRRMYYLLLLLDGVSDRARGMGILQLLSTGKEVVEPEEEKQVLGALRASLPPQRLFKLYLEFIKLRINNRRARSWILPFLLNSPQLELWAVKYRKKLRKALQHTLGKRRASILRSILAKPAKERSEKENKILQQWLGKFIQNSPQRTLEIVGFLLGVENGLTLTLLKSYHEAKKNLKRGQLLPYETLEGLRSTYHAKRFSRQEVLEWTKNRLTKGQKLAMQRTGEKEGVEIQVNFYDYDPVRLYLYAFERGWNGEIERALQQKARQFAAQLDLPPNLGILLDASQSMAGSQQQPLRPMAIALALRDILLASSKNAALITCGGLPENPYLIRPQGATNLAAGFLQLVKKGAQSIIILSDGYENQPAGRLEEVLRALEKLGQAPKVLQLSPTVGTENEGGRNLAPGRIFATSLFRPESLPLAMFRITLENEPERALQWLEQQARSRLLKA
ncbi:MAG: VWA domain-containing protein [Planctomycetota bacterium]|nr:MAG: VWA domain-containing protein [Planctomycetota bacterium]